MQHVSGAAMGLTRAHMQKEAHRICCRWRAAHAFHCGEVRSKLIEKPLW